MSQPDASISLVDHPSIPGLVNFRDSDGNLIKSKPYSINIPSEGFTGELAAKSPYTDLSITAVDDIGDMVSYDLIASGNGKSVKTRLQGSYIPGTSYVDGYQRIEEINLGDDYLILPRSNVEFAGQIFESITATSGVQFVPYHGKATAVASREPVYTAISGEKITLPEVGQTISLPRGLVLDQEIYGKNPNSSKDQVVVRTLTKFYPDGLIEVEGEWRFLVDTKVGSVYAPMTPYQRDDMTSLEHANGTISLDTTDPGSTVTYDIPEMDGGVFKSSNRPNIRVAWDWVDPGETLRGNEADRKSAGTITFIQRRADGINKVYPHVWNPNTVVSAGTSWNFKARWRYMEVK